MMVQKIILYYKFMPLEGLETARDWQRNLCQQLHLRGRILISKHGINGTLGGDQADLKQYIEATTRHVDFKGMKFKWSDGSREDFPKLSVKVRNEIVTFGAPDEIVVDKQGVVGGGQHLLPEQVHQLVQDRGSDVIFFDGRNDYEAAVGRFKNAIIPAVTHSREFISVLDDPKYDAIKNKPVVTYCTGGIRCEVLSALMIKHGFSEVYQLDGGIVEYGKKYGDNGLWEGSLYVFDKRMGQKFSRQAVDIGSCLHCQQVTSNYQNCQNVDCNKLMLVCDACQSKALCQDCTNQRQLRA